MMVEAVLVLDTMAKRCSLPTSLSSVTVQKKMAVAPRIPIPCKCQDEWPTNYQGVVAKSTRTRQPRRMTTSLVEGDGDTRKEFGGVNPLHSGSRNTNIKLFTVQYLYWVLFSSIF